MEQIKMEFEQVSNLIPYANNARRHGDEDVDAIIASIKEFGFNDPIGVWKNIVVEGHGRLLAAKRMGLEVVPVVRLDHLTDEQRKAYALAHNKTAELSGWDFTLLTSELDELADVDMAQFGFDLDKVTDGWFEERERDDRSREEGNEEYNEFLEKFEPKKTTDDCYTPDIVYEAVADWVSDHYGVKRSQMVRPFYPGGDYQNEKYKGDSVVVDNPPFSILSEIRSFYQEHGIKYFLFAPSLSCIGGNSAKDCVIALGVSVTYENGAQVSTSFVTNLEKDYIFLTDPAFREKLQQAADEYAGQFKNPMPKYSYPVYVLTAAMGSYMSKYGQELKIERKDAVLIRSLDSQAEFDKAIFGGGYLLSEKAAAEKAAAEKAAAEKAAAEKAAAEKAAAMVWELSEREREIIASLG